MSVPILTAIADAGWEAELAAELSRDNHGLVLVRRCVDLADLLATAAAGLARAAVVSGDLRRLDRDAMSRLGLARIALVGVVEPDDAAAERRLRDIGIAQVVSRGATAAELAAALHAALAAVATPAAPGVDLDWSDPSRELPDAAPDDSPKVRPEPSAGPGRIVAIWGPAGAPGRSTIAVNLAAEFAGLGHSALLVDADTYGGVIAQLVGILDEAPGFAAACRLANSGALAPSALGDLARELGSGLRVLTGITRGQRWLELRPAAVRVVLAAARHLAAITVVDCGFCLEQDEELVYDTAAPRRNGVTLAVLDVADVVAGVATADPVGLARYVRALPDCTEVAGSRQSVTIVNRLRPTVAGPGDPRRQVSRALDRYAGIADVRVVPEDRPGIDAALAAGRTLSEAAPGSPARLAIRDIAAAVAGEPGPLRGRRRARRARR